MKIKITEEERRRLEAKLRKTQEAPKILVAEHHRGMTPEQTAKGELREELDRLARKYGYHPQSATIDIKNREYEGIPNADMTQKMITLLSWILSDWDSVPDPNPDLREMLRILGFYEKEERKWTPLGEILLHQTQEGDHGSN